MTTALSGLGLMLGMAPGRAVAQTVPPTLDPNRADENLAPPPEVPTARAPLIGAAPEQTAPENAASLRFTLRELRVEGASAIPTGTLLKAWKHRPGDEISVADVFAFANAITRIYGRAGYALSFGVVPQQQIDSGVVTVKVVEGFVDKIAFTGAPLPRGVLGGAGPVAELAEKIRASRPLRTADLERYLLLINDLPGVSARVTLSPSPTTVGGSVMTIDVTRSRTAAEYGYNSYLPASLDTHVVGGWADVNGLVSGGDRLRLGAFRSIGQGAYWNVSGDYQSVVGTEGLTLGVSLGYSATRPNTPLLRLLDYRGSVFSERVFARYPVLRSRGENLAVEAGGSIVETRSTLLGQRELDDRIRSTQMALVYDVTDATRAVTQMRVGVEQGINALGARGNSRADGRPDYTLVTLDTQRLQPLGQLGGGQASILLAAQGQMASRPLLSSAECSYGGRRFGRRFDAGELTGEHCVLASVEARWTMPFVFDQRGASAQFYYFADGGRVWQQGALLRGELRTRSAMSFGCGLRADRLGHISAGIEASGVLRQATGASGPRDRRIVGNINFRF
ncbi:ShlB/FhaC/HecB family hemolysin secretion/activation protein [Sphingomonas floccifaciens]|uniref:ShlB/FhaC/HecB family hemolysin secretion/activation protein n=1 Tax=Sphingomonas floccifaciens TaxID=1844115 RepID=A0ABW4NC74_9SPHN